MSEKDPVLCPHCGGELSLSVVSEVMAEHRMSIVIKPAEGQLLTATTVGGAISDMEGLLKACGKAHGADTNLLVESISSEEGAVTVNYLVTNVKAPKARRKA